MSRIRKSFIPDVDQDGGGIKQSAVKNSLLEILLRLASVNGYNLEKNIRGPDGNYMTGTDVALLTSYVLQPDRLIRGKAEFVQLLLQAGISPSLVVNENMKVYLPDTHQSSAAPPPPPPPPSPTPLPPTTPAPQTPTPPADLPPPRLIYNPPNPTRKRGRPRKSFPPPPPLEGPFHRVEADAHDVPLPDESIGNKRAADSVIDQPPEKRARSYQTIEDISDDDDGPIPVVSIPTPNKVKRRLKYQ